MDEIYRMLGNEHEADLEHEAQKRHRATELKEASNTERSRPAVPNVVRRRARLHTVLARVAARAGLATGVELKEER